MCPILGHHRPVECHETGFVDKVCKQSCKITVPHKDLGMILDLLQIEFLQQIIRTVSTTSAQNRSYLLAHEHFFELIPAPLDRSCEIQVLFENRIEIKRLIPGASQCLATGLQFWTLDVASRRNHSHHVARA